MSHAVRFDSDRKLVKKPEFVSYPECHPPFLPHSGSSKKIGGIHSAFSIGYFIFVPNGSPDQ
jgi:hypothetical protein